MINKPTRPAIPPLDQDRIRDIAEAVYRDRLGPRDVARMIAEDKDNGEKLRGRAACYAPLVVPFCPALGVEVPRALVVDGGAASPVADQS